MPLMRFNTASGMDCMQLMGIPVTKQTFGVSIPQAVWIACNRDDSGPRRHYLGFNTASGMDCMQ